MNLPVPARFLQVPAHFGPVLTLPPTTKECLLDTNGRRHRLDITVPFRDTWNAAGYVRAACELLVHQHDWNFIVGGRAWDVTATARTDTDNLEKRWSSMWPVRLEGLARAVPRAIAPLCAIARNLDHALAPPPNLMQRTPQGRTAFRGLVADSVCRLDVALEYLYPPPSWAISFAPRSSVQYNALDIGLLHTIEAPWRWRDYDFSRGTPPSFDDDRMLAFMAVLDLEHYACAFQLVRDSRKRY